MIVPAFAGPGIQVDADVRGWRAVVIVWSVVNRILAAPRRSHSSDLYRFRTCRKPTVFVLFLAAMRRGEVRYLATDACADL